MERVARLLNDKWLQFDKKKIKLVKSWQIRLSVNKTEKQVIMK